MHRSDTDPEGSCGSPAPSGDGEQTREGPTMLSETLGMLAMLPIVFGVAGYVMVSR
jgi:hypothetical protein